MLGGDGKDYLAGSRGFDLLDGGSDDDKFEWVYDDHSDTVLAGAGNDLQIIDSGPLGNDFFTLVQITPNNVLVKRTNLTPFLVDLLDLERLQILADIGDDTLALNDLPGTTLTEILFDGEAGNDTFIGPKSARTYTINGINQGTVSGDGNAKFVGTENLTAGGAADRINIDIAGQLTGIVDGGKGNDTIVGGDLADQINGGFGDDHIDGRGGADTINAGDGSDTVNGGLGNDVIDFGAGTDTALSLFNANYKVTASTFAATTLADVDSILNLEIAAIYADAGNQSVDLSTFNGTSIVFTGGGDDTIVGSGKFDYVNAGNGNNQIFSGGGDDAIFSGSGNDRIDSGSGNDYVDAGAGADIVVAGAGNDTVFLGDGDDNADLGSGNDLVEGGVGNDAITGGTGDDTMTGGSGNDRLQGDDGHDRLLGNDGDDTLVGNLGNDTMDGGLGTDVAGAPFGIDFISNVP